MPYNTTTKMLGTNGTDYLGCSAEDLLLEEHGSFQRLLDMTQEKLATEESLAWHEISKLLNAREEEFKLIKTLELKRKDLPSGKRNHASLQDKIQGLISLLTEANAHLYERLRIEKMQIAKDLTQVADYRSRGTATMTLTMDEEREHLIDIQQK